MTTRKFYLELRYVQRMTMTELVCFELDALATTGMTDDEIIGKYGRELCAAEADGGMEEPEADDWDWDRDALDLVGFELGAPTSDRPAKRTVTPIWVPKVCAPDPQCDNPLLAPDYRQIAVDFEAAMLGAMREGNLKLARTLRDAADAAWKNAEEMK